MTAFIARLAKIQEQAGLNAKELYTWLGIPKSTYENWLRGVEPRTYTVRQIEDGPLKSLERELNRAKPRLPPPLSIRHRERLAYVERVRRDYH